MEDGEPRVRRRGFLGSPDPTSPDPDPVDHDSAEGVSIRVRIVRRRVRTRVSLAGAKRGSETDQLKAPHAVRFRSATATDSRQPSRSRR